MMSNDERVNQRGIFKRLAIVGTICLIVFPIGFTVVEFYMGTDGTTMFINYIYVFWAAWKLFNAFGGISDSKFDELISSRNEGTKSIDTHRIHIGDTAVIHGMRSALLWLSF